MANTRFFLIVHGFLLWVVLTPSSSYAQHPIEIQRLTAKGEYLEALATYDRMPRRRRNVEATQAAARSAWALSLPDRAIIEFEKALRVQGLDSIQRARSYLSRSIIEYQEGRYRVATLYAEKMVTILTEGGPLRSMGWLVWGDSLYELESFGAAQDKYRRALEEAGENERGDIRYRLGLTAVRLGEPEEARLHFQQIPLQHSRTPLAMRHLAHISFDIGEYQNAMFWLERGRREYPDEFLDSWVDYAMVKSAIKQGETNKARELILNAQEMYPPSDQWLSMLNALLEVEHWKNPALFREKK